MTTLSLDLSIPSVGHRGSADALEALTTELEKLYELKKEAERLKKEYDEANLAFKAKLESAGMLNESFQGLGFVHASVHRTKQFESELAKTVLTPAEVKKCSKSVIDSKLVKALFPAKYEACQADKGSWTVSYTLDA